MRRKVESFDKSMPKIHSMTRTQRQYFATNNLHMFYFLYKS